MRVDQIDKKLVEVLDVPDILATLIHAGKRTEISYRSAWARSQLKKRGLIQKDDFGFFTITNHK
jgi:restriction endonuclease Mrr